MRLWGLIINAYGVQILSVYSARQSGGTRSDLTSWRRLTAQPRKHAKTPAGTTETCTAADASENTDGAVWTLTFHHEMKDLPCYVMTIAKSGSKLQEYSPDHAKPNDLQDFEGNRAANRFTMNGDELVGQSVTMANFTAQLSLNLESPIVDKTGLTGTYDFRFKFFMDLPVDAAVRSRRKR